jgi:hypothetical protein
MSVIGRRRGSYRRDYRRKGGWGTRQVAGSGAIDVLARLGFVARGIIYIVIGAIAVMLAVGAAQHTPDQGGALEAIASKPFGYVLLWIVTIGFAGLALGRFGYAARGVIVFLIGAAVFDAGVTYDPARAKGVDGALRTVAGEPFGPVLLIGVALGLIAFGLLSFFEAKWRRTYGGVPV